MNNQQLIKNHGCDNDSFPRSAKAAKEVKMNNPNYTPFALFMSLFYMTTFFSHTSPIPNWYNWLMGIKGIGTLLCVGLLLRPYWPALLKQYLVGYWHFTLCYCLPFSFTLLLFLNAYSLEWIFFLPLALTLLWVLVNWWIFLGLAIGGVVLALLVYLLLIGPFLFLSMDKLYLLTYSYVFSTAMCLTFFNRKKQSINTLQFHNQQLREKKQKNIRELISMLKYKKDLGAAISTYLDKKAITDESVVAFIQQILHRMTDCMQLKVTFVPIEAIEQAIQELHRLQDPDEQTTILLWQQKTTQKGLEANLDQIKQLLHNAINYIQKHNTVGKALVIAMEDAVLGHYIKHMPNHIFKSDALKITLTTEDQLPPTKSLYKSDLSQPSTWIPQQEEEFWLVENARIVDAHHGYLDVQTSPHTQVYVLPIKSKEKQVKTMEWIQEIGTADTEELTYPSAVQLENVLRDNLLGTHVDINIINTALDLIKKYHGRVKRESGDPFFTHPIHVALILLKYSQDQTTILAALLHDTIDNTSLTLDQISKLFGEQVAFLVDKASNLECYQHRAIWPDYSKIVSIMSYEDPNAALIKLCDRMHNIRTIQYHPQLSKQKLIAKETLDYFVPLANQLRLDQMAEELTRLSQEVMAKKE